MAGFVPQDKLEQIRAANDIVEVIGAVLPLKRAGANFVALCPFHREKSPSFNVNPHRQIFRCFGCQKGGDVFKFICEYESLSFPEAIKRLADRAGIQLEFENNPGQQQARHLKDKLLEIHEQITQRWQNALANEASGQPGRDYLAKRGVAPEAVQLFRLGCAPDAWDDTVNWARHKGFELPLVEQAGLILRKEDSDRSYDRFRGRLMFPICDEQGRVIAFSGRVLGGDEKTAKYVNSPETAIFTKGKVFYGLDKSKRAILDAGVAILCEGQLDLIACHTGGVRNVVAPQGTALTPDHARILKRYVEEVVLCFDSDNAGQNAAVRSLDSLLAVGVSVRVAVVPAPHDPDSYIREHGGPAFAELIRKAEGFFDFYLGRLCAQQDLTTDRGRMAVVKAMGEALQKTASAVMLDTYAQKTAVRLGVAAEAMRTEFRKAAAAARAAAGRFRPELEAGPVDSAPGVPGSQAGAGSNEPGGGGTAGGTEASPPAARPVAPPSEREFWLLRFLLSDEENHDWASRTLDPEWVQHPILRQVVAQVRDQRLTGAWRGVPTLLDSLPDPAAADLITRAATTSVSKENLLRNLVENIRMIRNDFLDRQVAACRTHLARPELSPEEARSWLERQAEFRCFKQQPLPPPDGPALG